MEERLMEERKNMLLDLMKDPTYVPMKLKELAMLLGVTKEQRGELEEVLNELVASGKVGISKKGKYARSEVFAQTGVFAAHHRGFGFVTIEGREDDLFIPPNIEALRISLAAVVERIQVCNATGRQHTLKLFPEQVPAGRHHTLKALLLS